MFGRGPGLRGQSVSFKTTTAELQRLSSLPKNAQIVSPQAPFAGGICFFLNICAKSRSLAALGRTPAPLFPQTVKPFGFCAIDVLAKATTHKDSCARTLTLNPALRGARFRLQRFVWSGAGTLRETSVCCDGSDRARGLGVVG